MRRNFGARAFHVRIGQLGPFEVRERGICFFGSAIRLCGRYVSLLDVEALGLAIGTRERDFERERLDGNVSCDSWSLRSAKNKTGSSG